MTAPGAVEVGEIEAHRGGGVVSEMREAAVSPDRSKHGSAADRGGVVCCGYTTVRVEHPLIFAGVSRKTETVTGHKSKEADSPIR